MNMEMEVAQGMTMVAAAEACAIVDNDSAQEAKALLNSAAQYRAAIGALFDTAIAHAHKAHKTLTTERKQLLEPADRAEAVLRPRLAAWLHSSDCVTPVAGMSVRKSWTYEIVDAGLVPREYLMVDEKKLAAVVKAMGEATNIPGVRVMMATGLVVKGGGHEPTAPI